MPTVTPYGASKVGSTVASAARQSAPSAATFGVATPNAGIVGQSISNVGVGAQNVANEISKFAERVDINAAEDSIVGFERQKNELLTSYSATRGKNAFETADTSKADLDKLRQKYADDLSSTRARNLFNKNTDAQLTRAYGNIDQHAVTEFGRHERDTLEAQINNSIEAGSLYFDDPVNADVQRQVGVENILALGDINGDSAETIAEAVETYDSQFSIAVIEAATAVSAVAGQAAFDEFSDDLEGPAKVNQQVKIEKARKIERTQLAAEGAVILSTDLVNRVGDLPNAKTLGTAEINDTIDDPVERSAAHREFAYQLSQKQAADSQFAAATYDEGLKFITDPVNGGSVEQFKSANPAGWEAMSAAQQSAMRTGFDPITDVADYFAVTNLPIAELAKVNASDYAGVFADADVRRLDTMVKSAKAGSSAAQIGRSRNAQVTGTINTLFGDEPKKRNDDEIEQVNAFYAMITAENDFREREQGSPLTTEQFTTMLGDMTRKQVIEESLFGIDFLNPDTEYDLSVIPAERFSPLQKLLQDNDIPVTADNLIRAYSQATGTQ